ncbi:MAG TPA: hypothetical protein VFU99_00860 [Gaiellaceae bacterium]|nr:hypothetical protein [Gaiellaceae bacterium]
MERGLALRLAATVATVATLLGSTGYVAAHPKDPSAPLQPPVVTPSPTPTPRATGRIQVPPAVRATALPGITFTHVS